MPQTVLSLIETQAINLEIRVDPEDWVGKFTNIEVWRSVLGEAGPYELVTTLGWTPAKLPADAGVSSINVGSTVPVQGKKLDFLLEQSVALSYIFTGGVALTYAQAAAQLNAAYPTFIVAGVDSTGKFFIQSTMVGGLAAISFPSSDAASMLGLPMGVTAFGKEGKPALVVGVNKYYYRDTYGQKAYYYKTRFFNLQDQAVSDFSTPISGGRGALGVEPAQIVLGFLKTVQLNGRIAVGQEVVVYNTFMGEKSGQYTILGSNDRRYTDNNGYVEFELLRGMTVDVSIPGTALMRRIKVPTEPLVQKFDLLDPLYGDNDAFSVQRVDFTHAERRSL